MNTLDFNTELLRTFFCIDLNINIAIKTDRLVILEIWKFFGISG